MHDPVVKYMAFMAPFSVVVVVVVVVVVSSGEEVHLL